MTTLSNFLRGGEDLNARRKSVLNLAFSSMDKKGSGAIEPEVLLAVYKPSRHPDVISGKRSEESALQEFLTTFDVGVEVEGKVTRNEFENHYKRMSYSIPEDEHFETMIRELYGVSGRQGDDKLSAMNKLLSQKDADARLIAMHLKEYREQLLHAEQISDNSKAVLNKLGSTNSSELSANVQQMNLNIANDDVQWPTDASSIAIAIAGPDAASGAAPYPPRSAFPVPEVAVPAGVAHIIGKLKARLRTCGVQGFVNLQRSIRSMDKHDRKRINMTDFKVAMKKIETGLSEAEVRMLFDYFNNEHRGSIDTDIFIKKVRSALNDRRLILVKQAFAKLDIKGDGAVDVATVAGCYDSTSTPDVIAGRMTSENSLLEFLGTFDVGGDIEGMVTLSEFINYYTNIGACVDNDEYFDLMVRNSWHVGGDRQEVSKKVFVTRKDGSQYIEEVIDCSQDESKNDVRTKKATQGMLGVHRQTFNIFKQTNEFSDVLKNKKTSKTRPLIEMSQDRVVVSNDHPALNSVLVRSPTGEAVRGPIGHDEAIAIMGPSIYPQPHREPLPSSTHQTPSYGIKHMILKLKTEIRSLGLMGFIGLQRRFRAIDKDNTKYLSLSDFKKAMRQMNMTLIDGELRILFEFYDGDSCGMIDYELLIRSIRDPLTGLRLSLVNLAFDQLDRQGSGMVDAAEVASLYDATRHPDVMRGSTSSQQALSSFLETFDVGSVRQGKVTRQEFVNYYSNISESVENDDYFELIIRNVWHVDGHSDAQSQAANNRVMITRQDGSQHVEEYKDIRGYNSSNDQLMDRAEQEQKAVVIAKLQGRVPPGTQDAGSIIPIDSVHKIMQTNKRRSYQHRSTVGLLVDATVKQHSRHSGDRSHMQPTAGEQVLLDKIKGEVAVGGARGLVNLQRALRAADSDSNSLLSLPELKQALHAVHHTLSGPELRLLFSYFDPFATGFVGYEQVVEAVRNPLSAWRLALVKKTFLYLDDCKEGFIEASRCALRYNASNHPEVVAGRMSAEKAQKEFLEIFDVLEGFITEESFIDYFTVIGSSIESDQYFELLIRSTWTRKDISLEEKESNELGVGLTVSTSTGFSKYASRNRFRARDPSSIPTAAGVKLNIKEGQGHSAELGWLGHDNSSQFEGHKERYRHSRRDANQGESLIITNLRKELVQRSHVNGYIALERTFRRACGRTKTLPLCDFIKVIKDLGLCMTDTESRVLFDFFDVKGMGLLDYREFIAGIRPRLSKSRLDLVVTAFKCLDREGAGIIDASLVISAYDPSGHPDVFLGVKSPEEVMEEWLSTFDVGGTVVGRVTEQEFITYYANIGASIGNEEYFELMLIHAWKPQRQIQEQGQGQGQEQGQGQGEDQKLFDDHIEPELCSQPVQVTFDLSHHEPHTQGRGRGRASDTDRGSGSGSALTMSASMQNWKEANAVFDSSISDTGYPQCDSSGCDKGPRHFNQRKSQIHFN